jgi:hypothetical protein
MSTTTIRAISSPQSKKLLADDELGNHPTKLYKRVVVPFEERSSTSSRVIAPRQRIDGLLHTTIAVIVTILVLDYTL